MKRFTLNLGIGGLTAIAVSLSFSMSAQDKIWAERLQDPEVNLYEVQQEFNTYWEGRDIERGQGYKQYKRWEWFWEPRLYPSGDMVRPDAVYQAVKDVQKSAVSLAQSGTWTYIGNTDVPTGGGGAGRINMVRVDPADANTYFACAPGGGLWKTTNAGTSWTVMNTDDLGSIGVSDVAIDHTDSDIIYLATGDGDAGDTYALGVLKSTDGGTSWNTTGLSWTVQQVRRCNRIIMDPTDNDILLVATSNGIYRTTDGGANWTQTRSGNFKDVQWNPGNSQNVYAVGNGDDFVYSTDNGVTWTQVTTGLPTSGISRFALTVSASNTNVLYILAGRSSDQGFEGFYRSTDAGLTWTQMIGAASINLLGWSTDGSDSGGQAWYDLATACDPTDENVVYVGGVNLWKTSDGGSNWTQVGHWYGGGGNPYVHADIHGLNFVPGTANLLVGCDGGVFRTLNGGASFSDLSSNLEIAQIYRLGLNAQDQNQIFTGWQDNGSNLKTGSAWSRPIGGDGFESIIDHTDPSIMYGTIYYGRIYKSTNGGAGFSTMINSGGSGEDENGAWLTPYVMSPTNHETLYVAKNDLHVTTNGGNTWTTYAVAGGTANALAVAPSDENYIYIGKGSTLYRSTDGGTNFTTLTGLSGSSVTYIAVDPTDPQRIWITYSGFGSGAKVYASTDAGNTWTNYSDGLPAIPCNTIVYQENTPDGLYVGTDAGVYYRDSSYGSWQPYNSGLPNVVVTELEIHYASNTIVAATYGRGVWNAPLFAIPANDAALVSIDQPVTTQCDPDVEGIVTIGNFGSNTMTSVTIEYGLDGAYDQSYNWSGSLVTGASEQVTLPVVTGTPGTRTFVARVTNFNGGATDTNSANDDKSQAYEIGAGEVETVISVTTDCWGNETTWELRDDTGAVLVSDGPLGNQITYNTTVCLAEDCYTFVIFDSYGDGLDGSQFGCATNGDYTVTQADGTVLVTMPVADFDFEAQHPFCTVVPVPGCMDMSACNYDASATVDDGSCQYLDACGVCGGTGTVAGCIDNSACNYNAAADCDDGSCEYASCACPMDLNGDDLHSSGDILIIIGDFGCLGVCVGDLNGDNETDTSDLLELLAVFGTACP